MLLIDQPSIKSEAIAMQMPILFSCF